MLITGVRHHINAEYDSQRSALFMRYLFHYLQMFAWLGVIIPVLIGVDFFCAPKTKDEVVTNKFYKSWDNMHHVEYHIFTHSHHFLSDNAFYENTNVEEKVIFHHTPIFKMVTYVSHEVDGGIYKCKLNSIYGWPLIVPCSTLICSIIIVIKTWGWKRKRKYLKFDAVANLGIVNIFLCAFTIVAILFDL